MDGCGTTRTMTNKAAGGKVVVEQLRPTPIAQAIARALGYRWMTLEQHTLVKGGKPLARGFRALR